MMRILLIVTRMGKDTRWQERGAVEGRKRPGLGSPVITGTVTLRPGVARPPEFQVPGPGPSELRARCQVAGPRDCAVTRCYRRTVTGSRRSCSSFLETRTLRLALGQVPSRMLASGGLVSP
eukprot:443234-Rhodomonas_salina.1